MSSSLIIQDLKKLIREILFEDFTNDGSNKKSIYDEVKSLMNEVLNQVIKVANGEKEMESLDELNLLYGTLEVVSSLFTIVQPGSEVNLTLNEKQWTGTWVDGSYYSGRLDLTIILDDESSLIKLPRSHAKEAKMFENNDRTQWKQEFLPDLSLVNKAIVSCLKCTQSGEFKSEYSRSDSISLILTMLLRISLLYEETDQNEDLEIIEPLLSILDEYHSKAVDIPTEECELELTESWRRIVDKLEPVLNYHYTIDSKSQTEKELKDIQIQGDPVEISEYSLPKSGYENLPRPMIPESETKAAIRLLAYWEKNIIPKIIEFVKSTYKPWEMEFYFEQLRHSLRMSDQAKALEDAMVMCEKKMPAGAVVPDESYDWSAKMPEEWIIGSWFLIKIPELKAAFGKEEIVVMLKAIDFENKIAFVEYIDDDSMRYNMWVPLKYDPTVPLNPPAVCSSLDTLTEEYENKINIANAYYAKKIIINHFKRKGTISPLLKNPNDMSNILKNMLSVTDIKNIYEGTKDDKILNKLEELKTKELTKFDLAEITQVCSSVIFNKQENSSPDKIFKSLIQVNSRNDGKEISSTDPENPAFSRDECIGLLYNWVESQWDSLIANVKSQQIFIEICKEYHLFANISVEPKTTSDGQEIIEWRDNLVLLPLHELFDEQAKQRMNVGMIVSFGKEWSFKETTSTLKFYSDERGANLIAEINENSHQGSEIRPLVFNYGKVWCSYDAGPEGIRPIHVRKDKTITLKWNITLVPFEWTSCWTITGSICEALAKASQPRDEEFESKIFSGIIQKMTNFYLEAKAPSSLKVLILKFLNKVIQNCRTLKLKSESNVVSEEEEDYEESIKNHFERIHVSKELVENLITESDNMKADQIDPKGEKCLYSELLQAQVELIVSVLFPTAHGEKIRSLNDLIELPKWLENVANAGLILSYLHSPKNLLSDDIEKEWFKQTRLSSQWERVLIISKLPVEMTVSEIREKISAIVKKHRGILKDIFIPKGDFEAENSEGKKELQAFFDFNKKVAENHATVVKDLELKIQEAIEEEKKKKKEEEEKKKAQQAKDKGKDKNRKNSKANKTPQKQNQESAKNKLESPEKLKKEEPQEPEEEKNSQSEKKEEKKEEAVEEQINFDDYNHWGAAIVLLEEFDLGVLTAEDLISDKKKPKPKPVDEEPDPLSSIAVYNCIACTLENPMENLQCSICTTPREASIQEILEEIKKKNKGKKSSKEEVISALKEIEDKYDQAISNRITYMTREIQQIAEDLNQKDDQEDDKRKKRIAALHVKLNEGKPTKDVVKKIKESIQKIEAMGMNKSILMPEPMNELRPQAEEQKEANQEANQEANEEAKEEVKDNANEEAKENANEEAKENANEEAKENANEEVKENANEEVKENANEEAKEEQKKEDEAPLKEENKPEEKQKEEMVKITTDKEIQKDFGGDWPLKREPRETIKVFYGNTIDDDFKSEQYLSMYLKSLLIDQNNELSEKCKKMREEILAIPDNSEFGIEISQMLTEKDLANLIENSPIEAWKIFEGQGYDFGFELSAFRTSAEYRQNFEISDQKQTEEESDWKFISHSDLLKLLKLITVDIWNSSILSPDFKGTGLKETKSEHQTYEIDQEWVELHYKGLLERINYREVRFFWALVRLLNKYLYESIYMIYCSETSAADSDLDDNFSLSNLISKFKIIIHSIKFDLKMAVLDKTSVERLKPTEIVLDRLKIAHFQQERDTEAIEIEGLSDSDDGQSVSIIEEEIVESYSSLLFNSYEQLEQTDIALLRPQRPSGTEPHLSFAVLFKGEFVVGEGGPYRQFFADLSSEIQPPSYLPEDKDEFTILVPTPNNRDDVKDYKEYWTINPSCNSTQDLALFEYLGILMGVCIRTNVHLTLDLANICWKPLVGEALNLQDLRQLDIGFINRLQYVLEAPKEGFEDVIMETFAVTLSDGNTVDLCPNGADKPVTYENRNEFVIQSITARLTESSDQCNAIKKGLYNIVPEGLLNLMTPDELKEAVCGKMKCDLELLKRNTVYGTNDDPFVRDSVQVKWLWEVLEEFSEEDRLKFIVFCWGQERLPANDQEFKLSKTRFMIKPSTSDTYGDGALPKANTCFFNFELPNYTSKEILKEKVLLAIRTDNRSMNAEQQEFMENQGRNELFGGNHHEDDY